MIKKNNFDKKEESFEVTVKGSLGLLAFGDIGLRAWREVKQNNKNKNRIEEAE